MTKKEDDKNTGRKVRIKKVGLRTKIIMLLAFILLLIFLFFFNKATLNNLIPVDYIEDPWPFKQACEVASPPAE
ncbi:MAG: hypothetical protein GW748_03670 [Alphaproteobacteria bacterium]|nr:hypothetical protein [Alphaproteobacteria bacterium]NCQ66822.1 hypothetical protein [Alphaproteobacteria bacterium]NCT07390.1 hypothetical protein [Alphaproteobacteria bacterium]